LASLAAPFSTFSGSSCFTAAVPVSKIASQNAQFLLLLLLLQPEIERNCQFRCEFSCFVGQIKKSFCSFELLILLARSSPLSQIACDDRLNDSFTETHFEGRSRMFT
jgi:hypothetical protein